MNRERHEKNTRRAEEYAERILTKFGKFKHETIGYSTDYKKFRVEITNSELKNAK